jgi:hypothetical protein
MVNGLFPGLLIGTEIVVSVEPDNVWTRVYGGIYGGMPSHVYFSGIPAGTLRTFHPVHGLLERALPVGAEHVEVSGSCVTFGPKPAMEDYSKSPTPAWLAIGKTVTSTTISQLFGDSITEECIHEGLLIRRCGSR